MKNFYLTLALSSLSLGLFAQSPCVINVTDGSTCGEGTNR